VGTKAATMGVALAATGLVALLLVVLGLHAAEAALDGTTDDACPAAEVPDAGFADVPDQATHAPAINCLAWYDVSHGVTRTRFAPGGHVRRGEISSFLARTIEHGVELPPDPADHFDDDDGTVHELRINQLAEVGIIDGKAPRTFAPHETVSRAQLAALAVRAFAHVTGEELTSTRDHFDDDDGTAHEDAINAAAEAGLVFGTGERRYEPAAPMTRAQMAAVLARLIDAFVERGEVQRPAGWAADINPPNLHAELVTDAVDFPVHVTAPAGDARVFVVERAGRVRIVDDGQLLDAPFLDISDLTTTTGERGLFALAFHPDYAVNGRLYVHYTDLSGDTRVDRFVVSGDPDRADRASRTQVIGVPQPYSNHNGGMLAFGPDGMLYLALGDGGSGGDPHGHGQDRTTLLGTILRLDVDVPGSGYRVPGDNPFAGGGGAPEIWAYGLRNPWRFAFDDATDHLYIADVGQSTREEVNALPARLAGVNYGWNVMEGSTCFGATTCDEIGLALPVYEYGHDDGCSITGGLVYRGAEISGLQGHYLFGDLCGGWVRSLRFDGTAVSRVTTHDLGDLGSLYSFGADGAGEVYVTTSRGVFRLLAS
jgi:glucose/arabinose dehydrogenase